MGAQTIVTAGGERLVVLPEAEYEALLEAAENAEDRLAVTEFQRKLALGEEELVPSAIVERLLSGENRIRVWRDHRGMTAAALADKARYRAGLPVADRDGKTGGDNRDPVQARLGPGRLPRRSRRVRAPRDRNGESRYE